MIKKIVFVFLFILVLGYGILNILGNATAVYWGHHFSFENELSITIDSLEITVGDKKTMIQAAADSLNWLEGNIDVPTKGYPHKVRIKIFSEEGIKTIKADSFNCYNCDGYHQYTLKEDGAVYKFLN